MDPSNYLPGPDDRPKYMVGRKGDSTGSENQGKNRNEKDVRRWNLGRESGKQKKEFPKRFDKDFMRKNINPPLQKIEKYLKALRQAVSQGGDVRYAGFSIFVPGGVHESAKDVAVMYEVVLTCGYDDRALHYDTLPTTVRDLKDNMPTNWSIIHYEPRNIHSGRPSSSSA